MLDMFLTVCTFSDASQLNRKTKQPAHLETCASSSTNAPFFDGAKYISDVQMNFKKKKKLSLLNVSVPP